MNISLGKIIGDSYVTALKNIPSILGAGILWLLTIWVPYINVGTTIALFYGMPLELSRGKVLNPVAIFDGKYRKFMGEFFTCIGMMSLAIIPAMFFMIIPGIIISIGWAFALLLLVDRELNPAEAMTMSTKYTYGHKWTIFLSLFICYLALYVIGIILFLIFGNLGSAFLSLLVTLLVILLSITLSVSVQGVLYRMLVLERDAPAAA